MDKFKAKRIAKKVVKNGFWIISDVIFLGLKAVGTLALIALTSLVIFACFFIFYVRTDLATGLDINPADFTLNRSSAIYVRDPVTERLEHAVTIQSLEFRIWVDFEEFPQHLIDAVVAIEDHRFWDHHGVDWYRTAGAFMNMFLSMQNTFGGSTITQQLIKNLTTEDDITVQRKLQEIFRALEYERQFSKEEILELYLNLVYFGHGAYGIGAAANYYFDKEVSELTLYEAAAIISITNNPSRYSPYLNRERNKLRQEIVLYRMLQLGKICGIEYRAAMRAPLNFQRGIDEQAQMVIYTWFEEAIIRDVINELVNRNGLSEQVARMYLFNGGLRIISTMNPDMQAAVDYIYQNPENLPNVTGSAQQMQSSIIIADPYTGEIRAMSGGVGIKNRNMLLNRATQTRRPPGSAIKPISMYAQALEYNILAPDTIYNDSPDLVLSGTTWLPRNADRSYRGHVTARAALAISINTIAAYILDQVGVENSYNFMTNVLGFNLDPADNDYAPLAAGQLTHGATVREMASAYTMFPNLGTRVELRTFSRIYNMDGDILLDNSVPMEIQAISDVSAYWMTDMLITAVTNGTGGAANLGGGMPTAGKTGTSTDNRDRWFVGYTPHYLAAVWTGFDTPARMNAPGGNPAAHIFRMVMGPIHENLEVRQFNRPDDVTLAPIINQWDLNEVSYTVIGVDIHGAEIYSRVGTSTVGAEVFVHAPEWDGWRVIGESFGSIQVTADPARNVITFIYEFIGAAPEEPEEPEPTPMPTPIPPEPTPIPPPPEPTPMPTPEPTPMPTPIPVP